MADGSNEPQNPTTERAASINESTSRFIRCEMTDQTTREQQLEAALLDFYYAADRLVRELNVVHPFTAIALKHAAVLRTLPTLDITNG